MDNDINIKWKYINNLFLMLNTLILNIYLLFIIK